MAENSGISWTDHTFNPFMGCTKVSPACKHCYAERDFDHRFKKVQWGPNGTRVVTSDSYWQKPLFWNEAASKIGKRLRVFCASLADVFEDWQGPIKDNRGLIGHVFADGEWGFGPDGSDGSNKYVGGKNTRMLTMDDVRKKLFKLIDSTPNLDWLLLTKRPENIRRMWQATPGVHSQNPIDEYETALDSNWRPNVWLGTSVENQEYAETRIPELLKCRDLSPVLFLSCEPLLGPVNLLPFLSCDATECCPVCNEISCFHGAIDWVICGGESGPEARPSHPEWFRSLRDQCQSANVPFHFKHWGEWTCEDHMAITMAMDHQKVLPFVPDDLCPMYRLGTKLSGRVLDGREWNEFPVAK